MSGISHNTHRYQQLHVSNAYPDDEGYPEEPNEIPEEPETEIITIEDEEEVIEAPESQFFQITASPQIPPPT